MYSTAWCDRDRLAAWRVRGVSTLVTPPASEPLDIETFALHSRITSDARDYDLLELYLRAAREFVEAETQLACIQQTWAYTADATPYGYSILLPVSPVISVTSVTTYDTANVSAVLLNTSYFVDLSSRPARLSLNTGQAWPGGLRLTNAVVVQYVAGYGTVPDLVPARLRQAILLVAGHLYENREAATDLKLDELPIGIQSLLGQLKVCAPV